jgi:phosphoglycolate phosphatase
MVRMTTGDTLRADAVVFDLDGVLVDSRAAFARCVNVTLAEHGHEVWPVEELHRFLGPPIHDTFERLVGGARAEADELTAAYRRLYEATMLEDSLVFDGIPEALAELARRLPLAVATSKTIVHARPLLEALDLARHFVTIAGPALEARAEPKALTLERALAELDGVARPVMVGDTRFDVAGARAHDLPCVGVLWGVGTREELEAAGAVTLVEAPEELPRVLA